MTAPRTARDAVRWAERELAAAGVPGPRADSEYLLAHTLGVGRASLRADGRRELTAAEDDRFRALVRRRARREPLQHVLGEWGFRQLTLTVDARALVPRPETEVVVERCLALIEGMPAPRVLDVGTGGGAIALAIADEHGGAEITAVDLSAEALALAAENGRRTGLAVTLALHDVSTGLPAGPWHLVVSNPPYVDRADAHTLEPEVRDWEPERALYGAPELTLAIARAARDELAGGGALVLETTPERAPGLADALRELGFTEVAVTRDLAGRERVVEGRAP